jgi:RimJ/RimL family protein N-acetyltransferase
VTRPVAPRLTDGVVVVDEAQLSDVEAQLHGEDQEIARRFGWYPARSSAETVSSSILEARAAWRDDGSRLKLAVRHAGTAHLVGGCELRWTGSRQAELSWWTLAGKRGRGFATRAVRLLVGGAAHVLELDTIEAYVAVDNAPSRAVARAAGFSEGEELDHEGERRVRYVAEIPAPMADQPSGSEAGHRVGGAEPGAAERQGAVAYPRLSTCGARFRSTTLSCVGSGGSAGAW